MLASLPWPDTNERAFNADAGAAGSAAASAKPTAATIDMRFMESPTGCLSAQIARGASLSQEKAAVCVRHCENGHVNVSTHARYWHKADNSTAPVNVRFRG